jgi:hypothetical protein
MPQLKYWNGSSWVEVVTGAQGSTGPQGVQGGSGLQGIQGGGFNQLQGVQGPSGSQGLIGLSGTSIQGTQGIQGIQGTGGDRFGTRYSFSTTTVDADPGNGIFRYNNTTIASVTQIFIDNLDSLGNSQTAWYDTWDDSTTAATRGTLTILGSSAGSIITNTFTITGAVTVASGYYKIPVSYVSGSLPANNDVCVVNFTRTGDIGIQGISGTAVAQGSTGIQGPTGLQGTQGIDGAFAAQGIQGSAGTATYDDDTAVISQQVFS